MTEIRQARITDIDMLAGIHVQSWQETYTGMVPQAEIEARGLDVRRRQWHNQISASASRIAVAPGLGFAQAGPQRDDALRAAGVPQELYAIYVLRAGQGRGLGRRLLAAVTDAKAGPMSALVLAENLRAIAFYEAAGAKRKDTRSEHIGAAPIIEHAYVWEDPALLIGD